MSGGSSGFLTYAWIFALFIIGFFFFTTGVSFYPSSVSVMIGSGSWVVAKLSVCSFSRVKAHSLGAVVESSYFRRRSTCRSAQFLVVNIYYYYFAIAWGDLKSIYMLGSVAIYSLWRRVLWFTVCSSTVSIGVGFDFFRSKLFSSNLPYGMLWLVLLKFCFTSFTICGWSAALFMSEVHMFDD